MKIADKISLSFVAIALILTSIASPVFYLIAKDNLQNSIYNGLEAVVASRTNHIKTYLEMLEISVGQLSKSAVLEDLLKIKGEEDPQRNDAFKIAMKRLRRTREANPAIAEFLLTDKGGKVVASNNESSIGSDKSTDSFFLGGHKKPYIKDVYYSEIYKEPLIAVSAPFLDSDTNEFLGVIAARVKLDDLNKIVTDRTGMGETGDIYIVNKYEYMITPSRLKKDVVLREKVDTQNTRRARLNKSEERLLSEKKEINVFPDYRGAQVLGAHGYIPQMGWAVLAEIDSREAFQPLAKLRATFFTILLITPIAAWLLAIFISGFLTGPIHKLHKGAEIIGSGNLDYKVGTNARDEIGQLARAFDNMSASLKKSTTSIENLNQEIALRKKTEKTLRELSIAVEQSPACVVITDLKGNIQYVNPKFVRLTGYSLEEIIGQNPRILKTEEHPAEFYKNLWDTITAGKEWRGEFHNKKKNGELYWESASISPIRDEKGAIVNFIAVKEDITERKKLERVKEDFVSTISHELRTPLTAIKEGINIVSDGSTGAINGEQREFLGIAKRNVDRLARLINEVLDFQKLESGTMAFNMQENDVNQVGREVKEVMAPLASSKGLELSLEIEEGLPKIKFDRDKITQALTNLVNNAIKFTEKGSVTISIASGDNIIKVSVRDTGPGMKDEDITRLFQRFVQLGRSSERKIGGTGLGLAISKDIIDKHNGKIWAESEPGKGSVFSFILPIEKGGRKV